MKNWNYTIQLLFGSGSKSKGSFLKILFEIDGISETFFETQKLSLKSEEEGRVRKTLAYALNC